MSETPICIGCKKRPAEIEEYRVAVAEEPDDYSDEDDYMRHEEGTFNRRNGHFLCTSCYIEWGEPSSERGWVAP